MKADVPPIAGNNLDMPALGFGTFELTPDTLRDILPRALELGYRHIDTAQIYGNEAAVGEVLAASGIAREDLFVTTKVWVDRFAPDDLIRSVHESLKRLRLDHVDLLLLHWPVFGQHGMAPSLDALMRTRADGLTRHIGISNFNIDQTEQAVAFCGEGQLATNQVEYHVYLGQERLRRVLARHNLVLTAYMPLAKARTVNDPVLWEIGSRYGKTAAQVALRWLVEQDRVAAIPATSSIHHARANIELFDFALDEDDRARIAGLQKDLRICAPGALSPRWDD
ncbi:aldo/keto reductase [Wenzhouxiangella marina]|uniref:Aldo/keto reductase n=1 Tax=Wenzhouxiangella marina TaxID=1579979 RepID=A0A0K0Y052_9GAMM|nr:aldo/keto reductase [Wenzhouxiangella marina]AKS43323.1 Aldo/keto reductase [Wenzhouxiangella marina]MBB6088562.1 diketogulonate reductase-like aldo/keto reductase [Wenzhouxiangella marina]